MFRPLLAIVAMAALLAPAAAAQNPKPKPKPNDTTISGLDARPNPVVFGASTVLSGRLTGPNAGGASVRLEADAERPFGDRYAEVARAVSEGNGRFSFTVKPQANTQYRVVAQTSPPVTSAPRLVNVRTRVGVRVSDRTPSRGARVRFSGTVLPEKDGRPVLIQRRSATGRFVTVARTTLVDAGTTTSRYSRRIRVRRSGVYRVKVPGDLQHVNGFSRRVSVVVG